MTLSLSEAKTGDIMAEAKTLHDLIYNIECYGTGDMAKLKALYAEIERRGYGIVEQSTVTFVESVIGTN